MFEILLTIPIITMFCVGLRIISSKGMFLYFLRKPYERCQRISKAHKRLTRRCGKALAIKFWYDLLVYIQKPLIGCCPCLASAHGIYICKALNNFEPINVLISCMCAAGLNAIIYKRYENS